MSYDPNDPTSTRPPYLGARYAAARDLSAVMTPSPRPSQFRPFIPYTLVYVRSAKGLEVQNDSLAPGALLWQNNTDAEAAAQQFRFEDAGNGFWYLRTHAGNLYMTADPAMKITQNAKYLQGGPGGNDPDTQRWKLTSGITPGTGFMITNAAYPAKTLQPAGNSSNPGAPIVLGDPEPAPAGGVTHVKNAWQVTSPSLAGMQTIPAQPRPN